MVDVTIRGTLLFDGDDEEDLARRIVAFRTAIRGGGGSVLTIERTSAPTERRTVRMRYEVPRATDLSTP